MARGSDKAGFSWFLVSVARGLALFLAVYAFLSLFGIAQGSTYNQNIWWIDLTFLPTPIGLLLQGLLVVALALFVIHVPKRFAERIPCAVMCVVFMLFAVANTASVYNEARIGTISLGFPVPFSLFIAMAFAILACAIMLGCYSCPTWKEPRHWLAFFTEIIVGLIFVVLFPLGQIYCFGTTDYSARANVAVVFGAQVLPDGTPSTALKGRLDKAIKLYDQGYVSALIMSGGIDVDNVSEAAAMRDYAVDNGVPESSIQIDEYGNDTQDSVMDTSSMITKSGYKKVIAVSSYYHLARIKMLYLDEGINVLTAPSADKSEAGSAFYSMLREIPGWWYYWLDGLGFPVAEMGIKA
ncbi:MAG: YdcF family protein [Coriobacteriales bacterium]|jgi:uncharacterized SAM-binding protein YcdF (DUF218 family)|nr:YdcF family protein [Coriobacteriales bacterium]